MYVSLWVVSIWFLFCKLVLTCTQVQSKKPYYKPFFDVAQKIALEPQKVEVLKAVDGFRFKRS